MNEMKVTMFWKRSFSISDILSHYSEAARDNIWTFIELRGIREIMREEEK